MPRALSQLQSPRRQPAQPTQGDGHTLLRPSPGVVEGQEGGEAACSGPRDKEQTFTPAFMCRGGRAEPILYSEQWGKPGRASLLHGAAARRSPATAESAERNF